MQDNSLDAAIRISRIRIDGESYFKISNSDAMRPFFMSIVSADNHWLFVSSNGGISAGRKDSERALFPYYTDDKIVESTEITGSKSIFRVERKGSIHYWEPFSLRDAGRYRVNRNLLKSEYGNSVIFEEINHELALTYRYQWCTGDQYGFIKRSTLLNNGSDEIQVTILDGIQNILPAGVPSELQLRSSNLVDAYKKSELEKEIGLGIYALSAVIVDKAEPSEALTANIAWSVGFDQPLYLLSSRQLDQFRQGLALREETDVRGEKGAYFVRAEIGLAPQSEKQWMIVADVNKNHADLARLSRTLGNRSQLDQLLQEDMVRGTDHLIHLTAAADGLQLSADPFRDARHFANTLFNIMRGGIFDDQYRIEKADFSRYLAKANKQTFAKIKGRIAELPEVFSLSLLRQWSADTNDADLYQDSPDLVDYPDGLPGSTKDVTDPNAQLVPHFSRENQMLLSIKRLSTEYLPLKFSRRHGDPSRPWNKFSINTRSELDGSKILDYEGNWRDIFQNWEALAFSYPGFCESMIHKFLNATTFDGYNPYRITKGGFDWETIEPDDPWSYIGYWGDHQIIYLLKLLEWQECFFPGSLNTWFGRPVFVYANVPYRIRSFAELLKDPKDTVVFDREADQRIREQRAELGADGALLRNRQGAIQHVNFIEKILATLLAKLSNFIPEAGIWMNTQRPEWNDANNALVGNGVSMVTLYYLHRFLHFFNPLLSASEEGQVAISAELLSFMQGLTGTLSHYRHLLSGKINDQDRKAILSGLGQAAGDYRNLIYEQSFSGNMETVSFSDLRHFTDLSLAYLEHTIAANRRPDQLYHAYKLMTDQGEAGIAIDYLPEMLEGQVAVLSSAYLPATESLQVLDALKNSRLFRADQYSYTLYPDKDLPRFLQKNNIPASAVMDTPLLQRLVEDGHRSIIEQDVSGDYHFHAGFRNANELRRALDDLSHTDYASLAVADKEKVLLIYEDLFHHKAFTGRSGTFFGYEGLGSIYWHMVSKLLLAVQECCLQAIAAGEPEETINRLREHYYEIEAGIGIHKPPALYGAFPTDPYSHTPAGKGAQQPGMTGQVKEDLLSRFGELGVLISNGQLRFEPQLLRRAEFLRQNSDFEYIDVHAKTQRLSLPEGSLAFTYCQIPIIYELAGRSGLEVVDQQGKLTHFELPQLDVPLSRAVFDRTGEIVRIKVSIKESTLR